MTITANLRRVHARLSELAPHDASFTVTLPGTPTEDAYGYPVPGPAQQTLSLDCHADRLSAEDATRAGLGGVGEVWQLVTNAATPVITPADTLVLRLPSGQSVDLAVRKVSGTLRQVILAERP